MKWIFLFSFLASVVHANEIVEFHIIKGTGKGSWNTADTRLKLIVGQTLRVYNDDDIVHRLHTNGAPCDHGPQIQPNAFWDCGITSPYSETTDGLIYDHNIGPNARFYIEAVLE